MMASYLTRDGRLFELIADDLVPNYGLGASLLREAALRDVVSENVRFATGPTLALYRPVAAS